MLQAGLLGRIELREIADELLLVIVLIFRLRGRDERVQDVDANFIGER